MANGSSVTGRPVVYNLTEFDALSGDFLSRVDDMAQKLRKMVGLPHVMRCVTVKMAGFADDLPTYPPRFLEVWAPTYLPTPPV